MSKQVTTDEVKEVKSFLEEMKASYKNLSRDFSDAVQVAILIDILYPKLVELNNYPPRSNTTMQLYNWETLDRKVLCKLGLHQTKSMLDKLSKGVPGAVEALVYDILLMARTQKYKGDKQEQEQVWSENDYMMTVTVNKMIDDAIVQVPQKMILFSMYEDAVKGSESKDTEISTAQRRITHLENLLRLKEKRIEELSTQSNLVVD